MLISGLILLAITVAVYAHSVRRHPAAGPAAVAFVRREGVRLLLRIPFALIAATCLAELIPDQLVASVIGRDSGALGIVIAACAGGLMPGGPMVSFPLVLILAGEGAGPAQIAAWITGWSVFAIHRVISYESPMLGWRFVAVRLLSSWVLPIAAGLAMAAAMTITGDVEIGWARVVGPGDGGP